MVLVHLRPRRRRLGGGLPSALLAAFASAHLGLQLAQPGLGGQPRPSLGGTPGGFGLGASLGGQPRLALGGTPGGFGLGASLGGQPRLALGGTPGGFGLGASLGGQPRLALGAERLPQRSVVALKRLPRLVVADDLAVLDAKPDPHRWQPQPAPRVGHERLEAAGRELVAEQARRRGLAVGDRVDDDA